MDERTKFIELNEAILNLEKSECMCRLVLLLFLHLVSVAEERAASYAGVVRAAG